MTEGATLASLLGRQGALAPEAAVRILLQAATTLGQAHAQGVCDLDLDPSRIELRSRGDEVTIAVAGRGLPRAGGPRAAFFVAPEQRREPDAGDARSDVWALGAILYAALAGTVAPDELRPIQEVSPWVEPELARLVHAALIRDPARRCPDAGTLARSLAARVRRSPSLTPAMLGEAVPSGPARRLEPRELATSWAAYVTAGAGTARALQPGSRLGELELVRSLGQGGAGAVFEARSPSGTVAVKVIHGLTEGGGSVATPAVTQRFLREARAALTLDDPHVVRMLSVEIDVETGYPYLVMELLRGSDLLRVLEAKGALDPALVARLGVDACAGLRAVHARGVIHRDIKPSNLFLHEDGDVVCLKVCDFGTAKLTGGGESLVELTCTGVLLGSPRYMAPEQVRDPRRADVRSDIWSLCATLYEALAGRQIWAERSLAALMDVITTRDVTPLPQHAPWLEQGLVRAVHGGLRRDPAQRYQSVDELAQALRPFALTGPLRKEAVRGVEPDRTSARFGSDLEITAAAPLPAVAVRGASPSGTTAPTAALAARARRRKLRVGALAAATVGLLALLIGWALRPARHRALVNVSPGYVELRVGGERLEAPGGVLTLVGRAGEIFVIEARSANGVRTERVLITPQGRAFPSEIPPP